MSLSHPVSRPGERGGWFDSSKSAVRDDAHESKAEDGGGAATGAGGAASAGEASTVRRIGAASAAGRLLRLAWHKWSHNTALAHLAAGLVEIV